MVDAVSSLGAIPLETDAWGVDVAVTGSQKALMSPPGMAFISVSDRAWAAAERASTPRFYLDLRRGRGENPPQPPGGGFNPAGAGGHPGHEGPPAVPREGLGRGTGGEHAGR